MTLASAPRTAPRRFLTGLFLAACLALGGVASADTGADAQKFVQQQHNEIDGILRAHGSDDQIYAALDRFVDYDELARRSLGQPCPPEIPACTNHWAELNDAQKTELRGLLRKLVQKNYRKQLQKTLDYEIAYEGVRETPLGDNKIRTQAKSKAKPRDPAVQVDYMVKGATGSFKIVDIVTEGSSLTKNYYTQLSKKLKNPAEGYPAVVKKLNEKINKKETE